MRSLIATAAVVLALFLPSGAHGQAAPAKADKKPKEKPARDSADGPPSVPRLFQSEAPLAVTFTTNIGRLRGDRGDKEPWRWATLTYQDSAGKPLVVPVRAKTHGIWRLKHCDFPPVRLHFTNKEVKHTLFHDVEKPKFVNYCRDSDQYEQYILQEFMLYRVYQLLTPASHRVRLLKVAYTDSASGKREAYRYGFIIEDPDQLAARLSATQVKIKGSSPSDLDHYQLALAYLFEYFIGNTDFSFSGLHNTELYGLLDGRILPVAYDFDYAGAVNTSYATPDPSFNIRSVRDRKFRAYCSIAEEFPNALQVFVQKKDAIYALYRDPVGQLLDARAVKQTLAYFDDFYETVQTPQAAERNLFSQCQGQR